MINSSLPPGAMPLTSEDFEGLIPKHITTRSVLNDAEFINITSATNKYLLSRRKFDFSAENLFKLHKDMFGKVWKWAGQKRRIEKNIGVNFFNIDVEIRKLLDDLDYWLNNSMDIIEISARSHHKLVYIHPFNNGNGRWARLIVNLFLKDHSRLTLKFPEDELLLSNDIRKAYIEALKLADKNDFSNMISFHKKYIAEFNI
ncbi:MAG: mobile mystery protein B [Candidatus Aminicenantes bacterium]|nr:mobile mystery protein B [Candidatus Aminicenantes bacterium]